MTPPGPHLDTIIVNDSMMIFVALSFSITKISLLSEELASRPRLRAA